jgi:hypothetical protein
MENKKIKKMFQDAAAKAAKDKDLSDDAIVKRGPMNNLDHDVFCPFRSVDISECPLCKINNL